MLDAVIRCLQCPHCGGELTREAAVLRCARGHAFDIARQDYVNLLPGRPPAEPPDTPAMVAARAAFLAAGHFEPIARALADAAERAAGAAPGGCIVDFGAGPGYYLAAVLDRLASCTGVALDISRPALRRAARAHARLGAVGCDVHRAVPVRTGVARLVLDVFAPRNPPEMRRILEPDGALIVVSPTPEHLCELAAGPGLLAVDPAKAARMERALAPHFIPESRATCTFTLRLDHEALEALTGMGPSAWHRDAEAWRSWVRGQPSPLAVTASVHLGVWRPRERPAG
jgi:23S rRNA (guanine745-N1)-methyltransferase